MRVLVLSNTPFEPPSAGNRARIGRMVDHLAAGGHEVAMLMLPADDRATWNLETMRTRLAWLEVAPPAPTPPPSVLGRARARLARVGRRITAATNPPPVGIDDWCPPSFQAHTRACVAAWKPDVVLAEYVFLSAALDDLARFHPCTTVVDTHDVMHQRRAVYEALALAPQWFHTTRDEERRGLLRADLVLAINDDDAAVLRALVPERRVLTVPHAEPVVPGPRSAARPDRLLFVASYNPVNARGLAWFTESVWPALRVAVPTLELEICGNLATELGALPAGIVARGFVPDLTSQYAAARVVVNPILAGTGIKVKAVQALCHGRPLVTTRAGASGLDAGEAHGVLVADDPAAFVAAVHGLLIDDARWARVAAAAAAQAARRFAPEVAFGPLLATLTQAR